MGWRCWSLPCFAFFKTNLKHFAPKAARAYMAVLHLRRNFANHIDTAVHCCCILVCNPRSHRCTSSSHWVCSPSFKCTVKVYFIYIDCKCILYHILALTTDPGSQLAHQALIECAHPVLPAGDLLLRPTSLYLQCTDFYFVHICIRNE